VRKIHIHIGQDGHVTMRVEGGTDQTCLDLTRAFEEAVGQVEEREMVLQEPPDPLYVPADVHQEIQEF